MKPFNALCLISSGFSSTGGFVVVLDGRAVAGISLFLPLLLASLLSLEFLANSGPVVVTFPAEG